MGFSGYHNPKVDPPPSLDSCGKRKRCHALPVAETLKLWRENSEAKQARKAPAKGSKTGCMKGRGRPQNQSCNYRGVRQRTWGKWVAEVRAPNGGKRLWLGTFPTAFGAAMAYDEAAIAMHGEKAILNMPHVSDSESVATSSVSHLFSGATTAAAAVSDSMTCASSNSEICDENVGGEGETTGMATAAATVSDCMTCASSNCEICYKNVGDEVETTGMNIQFRVDSDSEAPLTGGGMNLTVNGIQVCDKKAEAKVNNKAKPGDYCWLDELEFFYDISMDFAGNIGSASFYNESEIFNVIEFLG